MLVVDRVVLEMLDERRKVRELERRRSLFREEHLHPRDEVVDVRNLSEDVVAEDQARPPTLLDEPVRELEPEELGKRRDAAGDRRLGDVLRRVDPEHRNAVREKVLEQVAVVRCELDDEVVGPERKTLHDHLDVTTGMVDPRVRVRREVRVLGENALRRDELRDLHEPAGGADPCVQRIEDLGLTQAAFGENRLAQRRLAEVDEAQRERASAMPARRRAARRLALGGLGESNTHHPHITL